MPAVSPLSHDAEKKRQFLDGSDNYVTHSDKRGTKSLGRSRDKDQPEKTSLRTSVDQFFVFELFSHWFALI